MWAGVALGAQRMVLHRVAHQTIQLTDGWWKLCLQRARRLHPLRRPRHYRHRIPQVLTVQHLTQATINSLAVLSQQRGSAPG